jgi:hypothetical protein
MPIAKRLAKKAGRQPWPLRRRPGPLGHLLEGFAIPSKMR